MTEKNRISSSEQVCKEAMQTLGKLRKQVRDLEDSINSDYKDEDYSIKNINNYKSYINSRCKGEGELLIKGRCYNPGSPLKRVQKEGSNKETNWNYTVSKTFSRLMKVLAVAGLLYGGVLGVKNFELLTMNGSDTEGQSEQEQKNQESDLESKLNGLEPELVYTVERGNNLYEISKKFGGVEWRTALEELTTELGKDYPYSEEGKKWFSNGEHVLTVDKENPHYLREKIDGEPKEIDVSPLACVNENIEQKLNNYNHQNESDNPENSNSGWLLAFTSFSTLSFLSLYNRKKTRNSTDSGNDKKVDRAPENVGFSYEEGSKKNPAKDYEDSDFSCFENDKKLQKKLDVYISYLGCWDNKYNRESELFSNYSRFDTINNAENLAKSKGIAKSTFYKYVNWVEDKLLHDNSELSAYLHHKINAGYQACFSKSKENNQKEEYLKNSIA